MVEIRVASIPLFERTSGSARRPDFVGMVEAAYQFELDDAEWLKRAMSEARPALDSGIGVAAWFFRVEADGSNLEVRHPVFIDCREGIFEALQAATVKIDRHVIRQQYVIGRPCMSLTGMLSEAPESGYAAVRQESLDLFRERAGFSDLMGIRVDFEPLSGCMLAGLSREQCRFPARLAGRMMRVAAHLSAGYRLRTAVRERSEPGGSLEVDAVLDEDGKFAHAEREAKEQAMGMILREAARDLFKARNPRERENAERALALWRSMVAGRWSLVYHVDSDGKRFLLARKNLPGIRDPGSLSEIERVALSLAARSHSNKLIAYELGLAPSSVHGHLSSGMRKLGIRGRHELSGLFFGGDTPNK